MTFSIRSYTRRLRVSDWRASGGGRRSASAACTWEENRPGIMASTAMGRPLRASATPAARRPARPARRRREGMVACVRSFMTGPLVRVVQVEPEYILHARGADRLAVLRPRVEAEPLHGAQRGGVEDFRRICIHDHRVNYRTVLVL